MHEEKTKLVEQILDAVRGSHTLNNHALALQITKLFVDQARTDWSMGDLRASNLARQDEWLIGQKATLLFRGVELAGEAGEACNIIKKLERERLSWRGSRTTTDKLAEELGDVVICADLTALTAGVNLADAVRRKFNMTSFENELTTRLPLKS